MPENVQRVGVRAVVEDLDRYVRDLRRMTRETEGAAREMKGAGREAEGLGRGIKSAALGFAAAEIGLRALGSAAAFTKQAFLGFEQGIANAGAVALATDDQMRRMSEAALEIGRNTRFSALQATGAFEAMAASGIDVEDIINGAADAAASLAAAGGVDLPMAADVMSTAMAVWGLSADSAAEAANRLAGAANVSRFQVEDMALAVAQGGGAAAAAGVDFGDFTTAIAAIAPLFSSGSDAGTSFKTFLTRLNPVSKQARDKMIELGLATEDGATAFFDAQGNMKSMAEIAQILHDRLGPLSEAQRVQALQVIFGTDAMRAAAGLMRITRDEFERMSETMRTTDAAEVAARRMDTLQGRIAFLQSTLETMAIEVGQKVRPALKGLVDGLIEVLNTLDSLPDSTKNLILIGGSLSGAALVAVPAIGKIIGGLRDFISWAQKAENAGKVRFAAGIGIAAAAVIGLDLALNKFTGHGLIDTLTGAGARADRMARTTKELNAQLELLATREEKLAAINERLSRTQERVNRLDEEFADIQTLQKGVALRKAKENIEVYAQAMVDAGASTVELALAAEGLSGELRDQFVKATDLETKLRALGEAYRSEAPLVDTARQKQRAHTEEVQAARKAQEELGGQIEDNRPEWLKLISDIEDADERMDAFNEAVDRLIQKFAELDPQFIARSTQINFINERINDLKTSSADYRAELERLESKEGDLTEAEKARVEELHRILDPLDAQIDKLEEQKRRLEEANDAMRDNAEAIAGARKQVELLVGPEAFGLLLDRLSNLADQEDATDAMVGVANAIALIETDGVPAALSALEELKGGLSPEAWKAVTSELGPAIVDEMVKGLSDPTQIAKVISTAQNLGIITGDEALAALKEHGVVGPWVDEFIGGLEEAEGPARAAGTAAGEAFGEGLRQGMMNKQAEVAALAGNMGSVLGQELDRALQIGSPSRVTEEIGEAVTEGLIVGIEKGQPGLIATIDNLVDVSVSTLEPIAARIVEVADRAMQLFQEGLVDEAQRIEDQNTLGRLGARVMDQLTTALETGSARAFELTGETMARLFAEIEEALDPEEAGALMQRVMDAMNTVIESGGQEGVEALRAILAEIQAMLQQAAEAADDLASTAGGGAGAGGKAGAGGGGATATSSTRGTSESIGPNQLRVLSEGVIGTTRIGGVETPWRWATTGRKVAEVGGRKKYADLTEADKAALREAFPNFRGMLAEGTPRVPATGLYQLHEGEMVLPPRVAEALRRAIANGAGDSLASTLAATSGPRRLASAEALGVPGGAGTSIVIDFSGAQLTGSIEENRQVLREIVQDVLVRQVTRGAFLGARRR